MPRSVLDSTYPPFHFILRTNAINSQFVDGENEAQRLTCFVVDLEWEQDLQAYKAINSYLLGKCWIGKKGNKTTKQNNGHSAWKPVGRAVMEFSPVPRCSPSVWQRLPRCGRDGFGFLIHHPCSFKGKKKCTRESVEDSHPSLFLVPESNFLFSWEKSGWVDE